MSSSVTPFAITPTTWNPSDKAALITLSNGNRTATSTGAGNNNVRSIFSASSGKWYFEIAVDNTNYLGIAPSTQSLTGTAISTGATCCVVASNGWVYINGSINSNISIDYSSGSTIGVAIDLDNKRIWFRQYDGVNGDRWNGSTSNNPATNTGGISISAIAMPVFGFDSVTASSGACTANFGASAFTVAGGTVPSGFTSGFGAVLPTDMRATQLALEQWGVGAPDMQVTQVAMEMWGNTQTVNPLMIATQMAMEMWASADTVVVPPVSSMQPRGWILA